jgi:hypothetical protein
VLRDEPLEGDAVDADTTPNLDVEELPSDALGGAATDL